MKTAVRQLQTVKSESMNYSGLPLFFKNLKIKKVKENTRGNPVKSYIFTFTPEKTGKWIEGKYDKADEWFQNQLGDEKIEPVPMYDWLNDKK